MSAVAVLETLGLRADESEFDPVATRLYTELAEEARRLDGGEAEEAARRLEAPSASSREAKKLLYLAVRALRPELVVETGPFNGAASAFMLQALEDNGTGRLVSFDLPDAADALGVPVPAGREPGWLVPDRLRPRYEVVLGDVRSILRPRLAAEPSIDLFLHDSLHTARQMLFEYRTAWRRLRSGGLLVSDDVSWNRAFWAFTKLHRARFGTVGEVGVTRKP